MSSKRKRGRLIRAINKKLIPYRWMGCNIAVYDVTVQAKAVGNGETWCRCKVCEGGVCGSCVGLCYCCMGSSTCCGGICDASACCTRIPKQKAKYSTKRRGGRSRVKKVRKRRRVIAADPVSLHTSRPRKVSNRAFVLVTHRQKYIEGLLEKCFQLHKKGFAAKLKGGRDRRIRYQKLRDRLVDVMSRSSGDSREFCRNKATLYLKVKTLGFDSFPRAEEDDELTFEHTRISTHKGASPYQYVKPPPSLTGNHTGGRPSGSTNPRSKARPRVGRPPPLKERLTAVPERKQKVVVANKIWPCSCCKRAGPPHVPTCELRLQRRAARQTVLT